LTKKSVYFSYTQRLWLTDAYYAGTTAYVQALRAAAVERNDAAREDLCRGLYLDARRFDESQLAFFPRLLAYPLTAVFVWIAVALLYRGYKLHRRKDQRETGALQPSGSSSSRAEESTRVVESKRD
jgi:hypothetical protein